jgi:type II secretory pathway component GspD/PulD (secretin)
MMNTSKGGQLKTWILSLFFLLGILSLGNVYAQTCNSVQSCLDINSKLTGNKYLIDKDVKGKVRGNFQLNKKNAHQLLGEILFMNGYVRQHITDNTYKVIQARDARYSNAKVIEVDFKTSPKIDFANDLYHMVYTPRSDFFGGEVARNMRPFMSRYGRIIDFRTTGHVILHEHVSKIKDTYEMLKAFDIKPTKAMLEKRKKRREKNDRIRELNARFCGKQ